MNGKKARKLRKKYGVAHVRLAKQIMKDEKISNAARTRT